MSNKSSSVSLTLLLLVPEKSLSITPVHITWLVGDQKVAGFLPIHQLRLHCFILGKKSMHILHLQSDW